MAKLKEKDPPTVWTFEQDHNLWMSSNNLLFVHIWREDFAFTKHVHVPFSILIELIIILIEILFLWPFISGGHWWYLGLLSFMNNNFIWKLIADVNGIITYHNIEINIWEKGSDCNLQITSIKGGLYNILCVIIIINFAAFMSKWCWNWQ